MMLDDRYIYSFIHSQKNDIALQLLCFFEKKCSKYRIINYNSEETIVSKKDDFLKNILESISLHKKCNFLPCYLEMSDDSSVIFNINTEECIVEYCEKCHKEYINFIISLIGSANVKIYNPSKINELISKFELALFNKLNYLKKVELWGIDKILPYDNEQIDNIFNGEYNELFELYPDTIIKKIELIKSGFANEKNFQDIIYQNILIRVTMEKNE